MSPLDFHLIINSHAFRFQPIRTLESTCKTLPIFDASTYINHECSTLPCVVWTLSSLYFKCLHFLTNRSFSVYDLLCECHSFMGKIGISRKFDILEIYLIHQYLGQMHFAENEPRDWWVLKCLSFSIFFWNYRFFIKQLHFKLIALLPKQKIHTQISNINLRSYY